MATVKKPMMKTRPVAPAKKGIPAPPPMQAPMQAPMGGGPMMKKGGKMKKYQDGGKAKSFPDLNKDGKITKADVLVGRGVIKAKSGAKMSKAAAMKKYESSSQDKKADAKGVSKLMKTGKLMYGGKMNKKK